MPARQTRGRTCFKRASSADSWWLEAQTEKSKATEVPMRTEGVTWKSNSIETPPLHPCIEYTVYSPPRISIGCAVRTPPSCASFLPCSLSQRHLNESCSMDHPISFCSCPYTSTLGVEGSSLYVGESRRIIKYAEKREIGLPSLPWNEDD